MVTLVASRRQVNGPRRFYGTFKTWKTILPFITFIDGAADINLELQTTTVRAPAKSIRLSTGIRIKGAEVSDYCSEDTFFLKVVLKYQDR